MADNNITLLLTAWMTEFQACQDVMQAVLSERSVETAVGAQLDVLGVIVGQARAGLEDELYRRYIRARILTNRSTGRIAEILAIADLIVYDDDATYVLDNWGAASYTLRVEDIALAIATLKVLSDFLNDATAAGVRAIAQANAALAVDAFNFSDGPGKGFAGLPKLNLAPLTTNVDTVVGYRDSRHDDALPTLALTADGTGAGSFTNTVDAWVFHFETAVTTVAQFETAVDATTHLKVLTVDGVGTMAAGDVLVATSLTKSAVGGRLAMAID